MTDNSHEDYMQLAIEQAREAKKAGDWPFGAVVIHEKKVVGKGRDTVHTIGNVTDHAEMNALREACKALKRNKLNDCIVYTTNEPCMMCAAAIFQAEIPKVVIGVSRIELPHLLRPRELSIDHLAEDSSYTVEIIRGILKEDIISLFKNITK